MAEASAKEAYMNIDKIYHNIKYKNKFKQLGLKAYGITYVKTEILNEIYTVLSDAFLEFPALKNRLKWIAFVSEKTMHKEIEQVENAIAYTGFWKAHRNYIFKNKMLGISIVIPFVNDLPESIDVYDWLKTDKLSYIRLVIWHEIGHIMDKIITYDPMKLNIIISKSDHETIYSKFVSDEVYNYIYYTYMRENNIDIRNIFSEYICNDPNEIIVESFAVKQVFKDCTIELVNKIHNEFIEQITKG